jgi:cell filamentation protein
MATRVMLVHAELAWRAGFGIDWSTTDKDRYLAALTHELEEPGKGKLDAHLQPFVRKGSAMGAIAETIKAAPGLDGSNADTVAGKTGDPALKTRYEAQELKRQGTKSSAKTS